MSQSAEKDVPLADRVQNAQRAAAQWGRENDDAQFVSEVLADVADHLAWLDSRCDVHSDQPRACYLCL